MPSSHNGGGGLPPQRILGVPKHWEYFILSVLFALLLPLLPLPLEFFATGHIKADSLVLAVSIYALCIGVGSRSQIIFGMCMLAGICFAVEYGMTVKDAASAPPPDVTWATVAAIIVVHGIERYQRHVVSRAPFLEF